MPTNQEPRCEILKAMQKMRPMSRELCLICKGGRLLCGQQSCPLIQRIRIQAPIKEKLSMSISGPSPSIFVGWHNYPNVFIGPLTALEPQKPKFSITPQNGMVRVLMR